MDLISRSSGICVGYENAASSGRVGRAGERRESRGGYLQKVAGKHHAFLINIHAVSSVESNRRSNASYSTLIERWAAKRVRWTRGSHCRPNVPHLRWKNRIRFEAVEPQYLLRGHIRRSLVSSSGSACEIRTWLEACLPPRESPERNESLEEKLGFIKRKFCLHSPARVSAVRTRTDGRGRRSTPIELTRVRGVLLRFLFVSG